MKIDNNLLQDANFRQTLEANFKLIEKNIEERTLWNCGITSKGISIVRQDDGIIYKIVFLVRQFFGCIDTSYASMQELKKRIKLVELTDLTYKIIETKLNLLNFERQDTVASEDLRTKTDLVKNVTQELNALNANVSTKKGEISDLEKAIAAKKNELAVLEEKLKAIAKEEELEAKLQAKRVATQAITKDIEDITNGLSAKHAELIARIGKSDLGIAGWIANANQMIKEKTEALNDHLSTNHEFIRTDSGDIATNQFRRELGRLSTQIPLIISSKQYADFFSQLLNIETTGWSYVYYNHTYTITPNSQTDLQKTILREIKELTELHFTRSQMMALSK